MKRVDIPLAGGTVATWQGGAGPTLLFAHATGALTTVYLELLAPLADRLRVVAYDARGHGATTLAADPAGVRADWRNAVDDLVALAAAMGEGPLLLAGHSFGGTVAMMAAAAHPALAQAVLMIDPAFVPLDDAAAYRARRSAGELMPNPMAELAERRRALFPDRESMRARYEGRGMFAGWPEAALRAYLADGTRNLPDGQVALACDPAFEAAIFRAVSTAMEDALATMTKPFALLAAAENSTVSHADLDRFREHPLCRAAGRLAGSGHFLPVTHADQVRPWLAALATGAFPER